MRTILFFLVAMSLILQCAKAQTSNKDSIVKIAKADVMNFRLNDDDLKRFRQNRHNRNSDYFKPLSINVSNRGLLRDSVYVKAYRELAYKKTKRRRTVGHYAIFGGIALVIVLAIATASAYTSVVAGYQ